MSDHRMVLSVSPEQTVLWDQVQFTGSPSEFAWVLPVNEGARVELAQDAWIETLEVATRPAVKGPDISCGGGGSGGGGCSFGAADMSATSASDKSTLEDGGTFTSGAGVQVVSQAVVGPYETVIIRSSNGEAIHLWLRINHFAVPDAIEPILGQYTSEGFDFLALRLRPDAGVRAMRPVRVVFPGAVTKLPLRMVAAGVGAKVGLTLFVVTEGRYRAKNFPAVEIDRSRLAWHFTEKRSNYRELMEDALVQSGGRGWVTEYAGQPFGSKLSVSSPYVYGIGGTSLLRPLDDMYRASCINDPPSYGPCEDGPLTPAPPQPAPSLLDASADAAHAADAALDSSSPVTPYDAGRNCYREACAGFDDHTVALKGLHRSDVWVTRLRAELSAADCASGDLELEPAEQKELPSQMKTDKFTDPNVDACAGVRSSDDDGGTCACRTTARRVPTMPTALGLFGLALVLRTALRRRRR